MPQRPEAEYDAIAAKLERDLDEVDPATIKWRDTSHLAAVARAADAVTAADAHLRTAVEIARARGESWNRIAVSLGVSRQAARERFGERAPAGETR